MTSQICGNYKDFKDSQFYDKSTMSRSQRHPSLRKSASKSKKSPKFANFESPQALKSYSGPSENSSAVKTTASKSKRPSKRGEA